MTHIFTKDCFPATACVVRVLRVRSVTAVNVGTGSSHAVNAVPVIMQAPRTPINATNHVTARQVILLCLLLWVCTLVDPEKALLSFSAKGDLSLMSALSSFSQKHVEGDQCDKCAHGFYDLSPTNPEGCASCYCFGVTSVCRPSDWGVETVSFVVIAFDRSEA